MAKEEKDKKIDKEEAVGVLLAEQQRIQEKIKKEITFKTMPERFLKGSGAGGGGGKTAGVAIVIVGLIFMVLAGFLLYSYLVKPLIFQPAPIIVTEPTSEPIAKVDEVKPPEPEAVAEEPIAEEPIIPEEEIIPIATSTPATTTEDIATTTEPEIPKIALTEDKDGDGLFVAEEALLGTSDEMTDSDGDGYPDLDELKNFYDPAAGGGARIWENPNIREYINPTYGYNVYAPSVWIFNRIGDDSVLFRASDNQFFQIIVQANVNQETIVEWYQNQFDVDSVPGDRIIVADDWQGVWSGNKTMAYLTDKNLENIYVLSYTPLDEADLGYINIFHLLVNSFVK